MVAALASRCSIVATLQKPQDLEEVEEEVDHVEVQLDGGDEPIVDAKVAHDVVDVVDDEAAE